MPEEHETFEPGFEIDPNIRFPSRPPLEVRPDGSVRENVPGSADEFDGTVERFGIRDDGQRYLFSLRDLAKLFAEVCLNDGGQAKKILDRALYTPTLAQKIQREIDRG